MLYILLGEDDFSITESLKEIEKGLGAPELLQVNTSVLDGNTVKPDELKAICNTVPFMTEKRLVIVRELLKRFQPRERGARQKRNTTPVKKDEDGYKTFAECMSNLPQSTILILIDSEIKNDNPLLKALRTDAKINSFPLKRTRDLVPWILKQVETVGGSISPQAANLLARLVGSNLWLMSNEINKLSLFAKDRRIEEADVLLLVTNAREVRIFNLIDAVFERKCNVAEELLQRLIEAGEAPAFILFMLARQLQLIVRAKDMREHNRPRTEIQNKLGLPDFALQKTLEQSNQFDLPHIKKIYEKLLETDLAIKTGKYEGDMALNILIAELCQRS